MTKMDCTTIIFLFDYRKKNSNMILLIRIRTHIIESNVGYKPNKFCSSFLDDLHVLETINQTH